MSDYSTVLIAVDLTDEADEVAAKAVSFNKTNHAALHIVYVIKPLHFVDVGVASIRLAIQKQAEADLADFASRYKIPSENLHICEGRPRDEIHQLVKDIGADLVVIGNHGRHGLSLLLGSTANGVLHGSTCDVLVVRVGKNTSE
jgi:universal stress protein A